MSSAWLVLRALPFVVVWTLTWGCTPQGRTEHEQGDAGEGVGPVDAGGRRTDGVQIPNGGTNEGKTQEVVYAMPDAGDMSAEVGRFRDLKSCIAGVKREVPPVVEHILVDMGYSNASRDACLGVQAIAAKSIDDCDRLSISASKRGCRNRYAMYYGQPDRCSLRSGDRPRDPLCVAVSMRDPSMCSFAQDSAKVGLCRAIVLRNARPCRVAHETATAANRCAESARRWWRAIPPTRPDQSLPFGFSPKIRICPVGAPIIVDGGLPSPRDNAELWTDLDSCHVNTIDARHGAIVTTGTKEAKVTLGGRSSVGLGSAQVHFEMTLPATKQDLPATFFIGTPGVSAWIAVDERTLIPTGAQASEGLITLSRFGLERGDILSGAFQLRMESKIDGQSWIRGTFLSAVRDVMKSSTTRTGRASRVSTSKSPQKRSSPP